MKTLSLSLSRPYRFSITFFTLNPVVKPLFRSKNKKCRLKTIVIFDGGSVMFWKMISGQVSQLVRLHGKINAAVIKHLENIITIAFAEKFNSATIHIHAG